MNVLGSEPAVSRVPRLHAASTTTLIGPPRHPPDVTADDPPRGAASDRPSFDRRLRVLSFNVRFDAEGDEGDRAWHERRGVAASVVRFHRPDVVGLQEPLAHQFEDVRERVPGYEWTGVGRVDGVGAGEFVPIGVRADRFDVLADGTFWLSETPSVPGSVGWDAAHPRLVTWLRVRDRRTGVAFVAANTHFDHQGDRARERAAALARERLDDVAGDDPVLLTGDLNCPPDALPVSILTGSEGPGRRLVEAEGASTWPRHGPAATFDRFAGDPDRRIDHVLVSPGVTVHQFGVLDDRQDGQLPSDHRPVLAEVSLPVDGAEAPTGTSRDDIDAGADAGDGDASG